MTNDHLQCKCYQVQRNGTTDVYDFPDMFTQVGKFILYWGSEGEDGDKDGRRIGVM